MAVPRAGRQWAATIHKRTKPVRWEHYQTSLVISLRLVRIKMRLHWMRIAGVTGQLKTEEARLAQRPDCFRKANP